MIKLQNIYIKYHSDFYSLYDYSRDIKSHTLFVGDFFSGSLALMRILSGIDTNYQGNCIIDEIDIKDIKNKDFTVAYLPQDPVLFNYKTVEKNLIYTLKIRKINKNIIKNTVFEYKNHYKINFFDKKIKSLNISERKIVALLRAIIRKPKYILLENFYENLDEKYFPIVNQILSDIKNNTTIIACENERKNIDIFDDFDIVKLSNSN